jgi:hypothetical protein
LVCDDEWREFDDCGGENYDLGGGSSEYYRVEFDYGVGE